MSDFQPQQVKVECTIPVEWATQLRAIALSMNVPTTQVLVEAIALYISRHVHVAPTMAAGLSYEDLENEPDEVLWDFLPEEERATLAESTSSSRIFNDDLGDDLDEILTDFLEPS